jgi:hypothetical protein
MKTHQTSKIPALPLQLVLIVPFVLQIFGAVGSLKMERKPSTN